MESLDAEEMAEVRRSGRKKSESKLHRMVDQKKDLTKNVDRKLLGKFLIAALGKSVGYARLPDTVFRPLPVGNGTEVKAIAVDSNNRRLYVADENDIWYTKLAVSDDGIIVGSEPKKACQNCKATSLAVNSKGDLYFAGHRAMPNLPKDRGEPGIFWIDAVSVARGNP